MLRILGDLISFVSSSFFFFVILRPLACARMSSLIVVFHYAIAALKSFVRLRVDFTDVRVVFIWTLPFFDRLLLLALLLDLLDHPLSLSQPPLQVHYLLFECFDLLIWTKLGYS